MQRTANATRAAVEDMRIDHRCFDVAMPQELRNRSNVIATFKDVCGKGMPE